MAALEIEHDYRGSTEIESEHCKSQQHSSSKGVRASTKNSAIVSRDAGHVTLQALRQRVERTLEAITQATSRLVNPRHARVQVWYCDSYCLWYCAARTHGTT
eukprot:3228796-Rhodomonas_salina.1